jgi:hypothetical protein
VAEMEHTARLEVWVRRHRLSRSVFAGKGIEGVLEIFGIAIDRGEDADSSLFDCKDVYITIVSEGLPTDFVKSAESQKAFGWLKIFKDVRPLPRDYETGEPSDRPPIEAHIDVDNESFAAIASQLASAETRHIAANLTLRFGVRTRRPLLTRVRSGGACHWRSSTRKKLERTTLFRWELGPVSEIGISVAYRSRSRRWRRVTSSQ